MRYRRLLPTEKPTDCGKGLPPSLWELPPLSSAEQIAAALQVSSRTIHNWSKEPGPRIPVAFSAGKIIRYDPLEIARALGIPKPIGTAHGGTKD